jgi:hypothetical protein
MNTTEKEKVENRRETKLSEREKWTPRVREKWLWEKNEQMSGKISLNIFITWVIGPGRPKATTREWTWVLPTPHVFFNI